MWLLRLVRMRADRFRVTRGRRLMRRKNGDRLMRGLFALGILRNRFMCRWVFGVRIGSCCDLRLKAIGFNLLLNALW